MTIARSIVLMTAVFSLVACTNMAADFETRRPDVSEVVQGDPDEIAGCMSLALNREPIGLMGRVDPVRQQRFGKGYWRLLQGEDTRLHSMTDIRGDAGAVRVTAWVLPQFSQDDLAGRISRIASSCGTQK